MNYSKFTLLILVALMASACAKYTTVRHTIGYQETLLQQRDVVVLPTDSRVHTIDVANKKTRMYDYEFYIEGIINEEITTSLRNIGLSPKHLTRQEIFDQNLTTPVNIVRYNYEEAYKELYKKPDWEEKDAFIISNTIGSVGTEIAEKTNSKIVAIINHSRLAQTNGAMARDIAISLFTGSSNSAPSDLSSMNIAFIELKTGRVLWTNNGSVPRSIFTKASSNEELDRKEMKKLISTTLKPFNKEEK
jgi:hypothetical protein